MLALDWTALALVLLSSARLGSGRESTTGMDRISDVKSARALRGAGAAYLLMTHETLA